MPPSQCRATVVISHSIRNVDAKNPCHCTAQSEVYIFQIRLKAVVQWTDLPEYRFLKQGCRERSKLNGAWLVPYCSIRLSQPHRQAHPPRHRASKLPSTTVRSRAFSILPDANLAPLSSAPRLSRSSQSRASSTSLFRITIQSPAASPIPQFTAR